VIKFPSVDQFRNAIRNVKHNATFAGRDENGDPKFDGSRPIPTLKYRGTVKLHGTNAGIVFDIESRKVESYQSRERELTLTADNAGFMLYMQQADVNIELEAFFEHILDVVERGADIEMLDKIVLFGEWCGGNIQKGVAITGLPKMFVYFGIKVVTKAEGGNFWLNIENYSNWQFPERHIYNILTFGKWELDIDFNHPELAQNKMIEITEAVEAECPAGKHFGESGIGEGVVWQPIVAGWYGSDFWFKVKGEKHSVSKVKTLAAVDVEAVASLQKFVDDTVTEARLEQGLQNLINEQQKPFEMSSLGDFIRWVFNDIVKEESDTIVASQLDPKKLGGPVANKARPWYIAKFNAKGV
jgi:hypothetical protein